MAMGTRKGRERQEEIWYCSEVAEAPGHRFYRKLETKLKAVDFDRFCEGECKQYYADGVGRRSLVPGVYFRLMLIGFFEGIDSERGIAWRVADSLSLRQFLGYGIDENTPDHVTHFAYAAITGSERSQADPRLGPGAASASGAGQGQDDGRGFDDAGSQRGHEVDRAARQRRQLPGILKKVAEAEGMEAPDAAVSLRLDRKRKKKTSNEDWKSPADPEAEITKLKDGRTALAYKVEQAADMETGAIV
ncbi:MAG TPA: transposase, partial [Terriglobia bacterium]